MGFNLRQALAYASTYQLTFYGRTHNYGNFSVEVVPADHSNSVATAVNSDACGYLVRTVHGNFYLPGDGRFDHDGKSHIAQMEVDYLLVPINDTNLGVGFAALLTYILQPRVVVPCHYGYTHPPVRSQAESVQKPSRTGMYRKRDYNDIAKNGTMSTGITKDGFIELRKLFRSLKTKRSMQPPPNCRKKKVPRFVICL